MAIIRAYVLERSMDLYSEKTKNFGYKELTLLDILGDIAIHRQYNPEKDPNFLIPNDPKKTEVKNHTTNYLNKNKILEFITTKDDKNPGYFKTNNLPEVFVVKFSDKQLLKKYPFLRKRFNNVEINRVLTNLAETKIKMFYPISYYDIEEKKYKKLRKNIESPIITLLKSKIENRSRTFTVIFNTTIGYFYINNILYSNHDIVSKRYYDLKETPFMLYRFLICHFFNQDNSSNKITVSMDSIKERLNIKSTYWDLLDRVINPAFQVLQDEKFIESFKYDEKTNEYRVVKIDNVL